jgi:hypothetical protein
MTTVGFIAKVEESNSLVFAPDLFAPLPVGIWLRAPAGSFWI